MKKRGLSIFLIFILAVSFVFSGLTYAETKGELEEDLDSVNQEKNQVSNRLSEVKDQIDELQPKVDQLNEEVSAAQRIAAGLYELNLLCQDKGEVAACREMRKRFCAYSKGITGGSMLRGQIVEAATVSDYQRLFKPYMQSC